MPTKRFAQDDPAIAGSEVVLASDFDSLQNDLSNTRAEVPVSYTHLRAHET